jgi:aromatic-L-amino-acid decarboxylase
MAVQSQRFTAAPWSPAPCGRLAAVTLDPEDRERFRAEAHAMLDAILDHSIAFDFHKWMQVPYDAGFLLVRDGDAHRDAFASEAHYLTRASRGLAAGAPWLTDFGVDLSRGFRALKVWFTLNVFGVDQLGEVVATTCRLARHLADRVRREPELELLAEPLLNIVCFRHRRVDSDALVIALQESGRAAPSTTRIGGVLAIRAAVVNHRTGAADVDALVDATLELARAM